MMFSIAILQVAVLMLLRNRAATALNHLPGIISEMSKWRANPHSHWRLAVLRGIQKGGPFFFFNQTSGVWASGPVIKNKLFYFLLAEKQTEQQPQQYNFADYKGERHTANRRGICQHFKNAIWI
jgi:hypothetical protein